MMQNLKNTMTMVVESLINKFEEDQMRKEVMLKEKQHSQFNSQYTDNCSDSDSSFNQVRDTVSMHRGGNTQLHFIYLLSFLSYCGWLINCQDSISIPGWLSCPYSVLPSIVDCIPRALSYLYSWRIYIIASNHLSFYRVMLSSDKSSCKLWLIISTPADPKR